MKASILTIGDEILNGSTLDTNSSFMAENAVKVGIEIVKKMSVADKAEDIKSGIDFLLPFSDFIFITGGLGPTKDDITIKTLAAYLGQSLVFSQENYEYVTKLLSERRKTTVEIDKERCMFPENTVFLKNQKGTAPGMWLKKNETVLVSMPGVPLEMKQIFVDEVLEKIKREYKLSSLVNKYILTAGIWESFLAKEIEDIEDSLPANIGLAYLPKLGQVTLRLTGKNVAEAEVEKFQKQISERISDYVFSWEEKDSLEKVLGEILKQKNKKVTIAESCTGGKIAHKITSIAGCSNYFNGSVVTYSNALKNQLLNVENETLEQFGAVSEETVLAMAKGVLKLIDADYSIAVSGTAGPTGGTPEKPVGTVWIAVSDGKETIAKKFNFWPYREENIELSSVAALNMLRKFIK